MARKEHDAVLDKLGGVAWQARNGKLKSGCSICRRLIRIGAEDIRAMRRSLAAQDGVYDEFAAASPMTRPRTS